MSDEPIADDEIVMRHIPGGTTFQAPGPRITSKNFELRPNESGLSVSRQSITAPAQLMTRIGNPATGSRIAVASAAGIRDLGLKIVPDPIEGDEGHAEIRSATGDLTSLSIRKKLAMFFKFLPISSSNENDPG